MGQYTGVIIFTRMKDWNVNDIPILDIADFFLAKECKKIKCVLLRIGDHPSTFNESKNINESKKPRLNSFLIMHELEVMN